MRALIVLGALWLAGCGPHSEVRFDRSSCDVTDTGARSTRHQRVCQGSIRGVCSSWREDTIKTRQYVITCKRSEWVDQ